MKAGQDRSKSRTATRRGSPKKALTIRWIEWDTLPRGLGHGVEFHSGPRPEPASLVAFLDGYGWLHGTAQSVSILMRKPDEHYARRFLERVREEIEKALRAGTLKHGPLASDLYAWFNG